MVNRLIISITLLLTMLSEAMAQKYVFEEIKNLEVVNTDAEEINPLVSADGQILYFTRVFYPENVGGDFAGSDIWWSRKEGRWIEPQRVGSPVNNRDNNAIIGLNANGEIIYLLNSYKRGNGIAYVSGLPEEWTKPEFISIPGLTREGFVGMQMSTDYNILLLSMKKAEGRGQEDLYVSLRDSVTGKWSEPQNLGPTINTTGFEISPFLSEDHKTLFFASNGHGGLGDADIYYSQRLYDSWDVWSNPVNLGNGVNSDAFDAYFSISPDSTVYFASNRGSELSNLYSGKLKMNKRGINYGDKAEILAEAEALLSDLRSANVLEEILVPFEPGVTELTEEGKSELRTLAERLKYQEYTSFHLLAFDPQGQSSVELQTSRIEEVKKFISILGLAGKNIFDYPANQRVTTSEGTVLNDTQGILVIVKN